MMPVVRDQQVLHEQNLQAMAFPDGDGWQHIQETVKNVQRRLRQAARNSLPVNIGSGYRSYTRGLRAGLRQPADQSDRNGSPKDL